MSLVAALALGLLPADMSLAGRSLLASRVEHGELFHLLARAASGRARPLDNSACAHTVVGPGKPDLGLGDFTAVASARRLTPEFLSGVSPSAPDAGSSIVRRDGAPTVCPSTLRAVRYVSDLLKFWGACEHAPRVEVPSLLYNNTSSTLESSGVTATVVVGEHGAVDDDPPPILGFDDHYISVLREVHKRPTLIEGAISRIGIFCGSITSRIGLEFEASSDSGGSFNGALLWSYSLSDLHRLYLLSLDKDLALESRMRDGQLYLWLWYSNGNPKTAWATWAIMTATFAKPFVQGAVGGCELAQEAIVAVVRVGGALDARLLAVATMYYQMGEVTAVTCFTCYDQIEGCAGGDACPFLATVTANALVIVGGAGAATYLSGAHLLPLKFTRVLGRTALDCLKVIARRPTPGTPFDLAPMNNDELVAAAHSGSAPSHEVIRELQQRVSAAGTQIEVSKLNALISSLAKTEEQGNSLAEAGVASGGDLLGGLTYAYAMAGRVVRLNQSNTLVVAGSVEKSSETVARTLRATITRPRSMEEFADMLQAWTMICHAFGLANVLLMGAFLRDVVYDTMSIQGHSWQVAHELFLVYLQEIEVSPNANVNLATVFGRGSQDTLMGRAIKRAAAEFSSAAAKGIFRSPEASPAAGGASASTGAKWNGSFNPQASTVCFSYNIQGRTHVASALTDRGACKHNHTCNHWVQGKGKRGQCGGKHPAFRCDNPAKCDKPADN